MYKEADAFVATGNVRAGKKALETLIARFPSDRRTGAARYDLARLAHREGKHAQVQALLLKVLSLSTPELLEPSQYPLCRSYFET